MHKAFEYLTRAVAVDKLAVRYDVSVRRADSATLGRGIYLRDTASCSAAVTHRVSVTPQLHKDADTRAERLLVCYIPGLELNHMQDFMKSLSPRVSVVFGDKNVLKRCSNDSLASILPVLYCKENETLNSSSVNKICSLVVYAA